MLDASPLPLAPLLGERIARICAALHTAHGTDVRYSRSVARLHTAPSGRGSRVTGVELDDGTVVPADVVVTGVGIVPNTEWLEGSGLRLRDGVHTDAGMVTDPPGRGSGHDNGRAAIRRPRGSPSRTR